MNTPMKSLLLLLLQSGNHNMLNRQTKPAGYVTLISVLVVGAVGMAIVLSLILLGLAMSRNSFAYEQYGQARSLADACAEEGLQQIRSSTPYTGTGGLSFSIGSCTYEVTSQGGSSRTVQAIGTVGTITRRVEVVIDSINPTLNVVTWQEVAQF